MNWVILLWSSIAGTCFVLAVVHGHVWLRMRSRPADAAFALLSASVGCVAVLDLAMMHAPTPQAFMSLLALYYLPLFTCAVGLVHFVWSYFGAGRRWLGWAVILIRAVVTAAGVLSGGRLHFAELTTLMPISLLGVDVMVPRGVPNPWMFAGPLSLLLMIIFFVEALLTLWRRGRRRDAAILGLALTLFAAMAIAITVVAVWWQIGIPFVVALCFAPVVVMMAVTLGRDLLRGARLARDLAEAERRLIDTQARLSLAAEAAMAGFWRMDPVTRAYWATPQTLRMLGLPEGHVLLVDDLLLAILPEDRPRVEAAIEAAIWSDELVHVEYRLSDLKGEVHWLASFGGHRDVEPGNASQLTGLTMDITERKRVEEELAHQRQQLEHLSRVVTIGELSEALAHELNQPLAIVMANAEAAQTLMRRKDPDIDEIRRILDDIVSAVERASRVIGRLRTLLRNTPPKREPVDLNALIHGVLEFLRPDLVRRGVRVVPCLDAGLPPLRLERVPIEQVLIHLIRNGCDAMAANPPDERELTVATRSSLGEIQLVVDDRGPGVGPAPGQLFEPFHSTKRKSIGLGLSVCRAIVESHGGRIQAENRDGNGARFRVALPVEESED